jgi:hypothetical protein
MANPLRTRWHIYWPFIVAANLIVPLYWGWEFTEDGGRWGMALAILVVSLLGHVAIYLYREMGFILVIGGFLVCLTQLYPIPQMIAGMLSMALVSAMGPSLSNGIDVAGFPEKLTECGGFVVTIATAIQLVTAAIVGGLLVFAYYQTAAFNAARRQEQGESRNHNS